MKREPNKGILKRIVNEKEIKIRIQERIMKELYLRELEKEENRYWSAIEATCNITDLQKIRAMKREKCRPCKRSRKRQIACFLKIQPPVAK